MKTSKKIRTAVVSVLIIAALCLILLRGTIAAAMSPSARSIAPEAPVDITLAAPLAPARLNAQDALTVAERTWNVGLFQHGFTAKYGSYADNTTGQRVAGVVTRSGPVDVWEFTITGLNLPRPCGPSTCPPRVHTLVVFVDDKHGTFLGGDGY